MQVLAFAASNSSQSINKKLVTYAAKILKEKYVPNASIEVLDLNDYEMPIYSQDREEADGIPKLAHQFFEKIGDADVLLISYAEHNGSYTAAYKNVFDWMSRIDSKVYQQKSMVIMSTSPGPGGASSVLASAVSSAPFFHATVKGSWSLPSFYDNFDIETNQLNNTEMQSQLESLVENMI